MRTDRRAATRRDRACRVRARRHLLARPEARRRSPLDRRRRPRDRPGRSSRSQPPTSAAAPSELQGRVAAAANMLFSVPQTLSIAAGAALITLIDYRFEIVTMFVVTPPLGRVSVDAPRPEARTEDSRSIRRSPRDQSAGDANPTPPQPRLRPAPGGADALDDRLRVDRDRISAPRSRGDALACAGGHRRLRAHRALGALRLRCGRRCRTGFPRKRMMIISDVVRVVRAVERRRRVALGPRHVRADRDRRVRRRVDVRLLQHRRDRRAALGRSAREQLPTAAAAEQARYSTVTIVAPPLGGALFGIGRALPFVVGVDLRCSRS